MGIFDWSWMQIIEYASRLFLAALVGTIIAFRRSPDKYQSNLIEAHAFLSTAGALFMIVIEGEIIECPDCGVELEVISTDPLAVELAPDVEEDWGE